MESVVKELQSIYNIVGRREELKLSLISAKAGKHILLNGPVGVGKTTIAVAIASHLEKRFIRIDGDERYTEQKLAGWFDPPLVLSKGYTKESFIHGPLSVSMNEGAILLINELNRMPEGTQNVLLTAMDERTIFIPKFGRVDAKSGFMIIATQNPEEYVGTSQLSEALKDRFICINLDYQSRDEEKDIVMLRSRCDSKEIVDIAVDIARLTRKDTEIRRGSSIRGAIDLSDIFYTAYGNYSEDIDKWVDAAKLAFLTKIELQDYSYEKFIELLKKTIEKAIASHKKYSYSNTPIAASTAPVIDLLKVETKEKKK